MSNNNYYLGLDLGTDSVGWAATDSEYKLLKSRGQDLWGSYLFDPAKTADERRMYRTARRRCARVKYRLYLLQSLFTEEINRIDPTFFIRMNDSKLFVEDKDGRIKTKYVLFNDSGYTDKDYFTQYPTIFHLRNALTSEKISDVRMLYIAIHHIIKNRGHFLFEGQTFNADSDEEAKVALRRINECLADDGDETLNLSEEDSCLKLIKDIKKGKREKVKELKTLFAAGKNSRLAAVIIAIVGGKIALSDLYGDEAGDLKFSFENATFDDSVLPEIENTVGTDEAELIRRMKVIYDWSMLCNILCGNKFISEAKIAVYNKHKNDLKLLKNYIRRNCLDKYNLVFRKKDKINNYAAYIGMDKHCGCSKCSKEDFYVFLKKTVNIQDKEILSKIEDGTFMPKQISNANGVIPYQVNLTELKAILDNAEKYFPFLSFKSDGMTTKEKILSLMTFRIPYYVGPLNNAGKHAWSVRRPGTERLRVTPWNFDSIIDKNLSEEKFITNMTCKCTYLPTEDVLPAKSLLYSEFTFLNELNNLTVNGEKNERARLLIFEYAKEHKRLTLKNCYSLLQREGLLPAGGTPESVFGGIDGDFKKNLASYIDFKKIFGNLIENKKEMCEEIIKWATVISDKNRFAARVGQIYGDVVSKEQIKMLKGVNYSEWGRLSATLLTDIRSSGCVDSETGEALNIIDAMRKTGLNFMQLLSPKYGFTAAIDEFNGAGKQDGKINYKTVEALYCSPSVKRSIWHTVSLVKEIVKIKGAVPAKIFIEMARDEAGNNKKTRTVSRKQQIIDLYRNISDMSRDWLNEIEGCEEGKFNSDKVVLYYRQMGKCIYSGEPIAFAEIFNVNVYDIDHIYPQSKIKDDSLENRVLVKKVINAGKTDVYPLNEKIRSQMRPFWDMLHIKGFLSDKKYQRLIRNTPLTVEELADFVERQLVETRQSTKAAAEILKKMLPNTEIIYSKAKTASDFRHELGLIKVRELNDFHHAKDAFANIVSGNVYNVRFGHNPEVYFRNCSSNDYNIKYPYAHDLTGAWKVEDKNKIIKTFNKNTCAVVRFSGEGTGALFNATIKKAGANENLIPLKNKGAISDTSKYGGYDSASTAYFMLVKSEGKKGEKLISLECVTILKEKEACGNKEKLTCYCKEKLGLKIPEILIAKIRINTLFKINNSYAYLRGRTGERLVWCNANELILDIESVQYLKHISQYFTDRKNSGKIIPVDEKYDGIDNESNLRLYGVLLEKLTSKIYSGLALSGQGKLIEKKRDDFSKLSLTDQCEILKQILSLMQCNSVSADLTLIGGVAHAGINLSSKFIQNSDVKIIYSSPTGYYKKIIDINKFL